MMKEQLLHTPEGVRDIYGSEYVKKFELEHTLFEVMSSLDLISISHNDGKLTDKLD